MKPRFYMTEAYGVGDNYTTYFVQDRETGMTLKSSEDPVEAQQALDQARRHPDEIDWVLGIGPEPRP